MVNGRRVCSSRQKRRAQHNRRTFGTLEIPAKNYVTNTNISKFNSKWVLNFQTKSLNTDLSNFQYCTKYAHSMHSYFGLQPYFFWHFHVASWLTRYYCLEAVSEIQVVWDEVTQHWLGFKIYNEVIFSHRVFWYKRIFVTGSFIFFLE